MPVFKLALKIIKKNIPMLSIYFGVFVMVSLIMVNVARPAPQGVFSETRTNMAFFAGEETPLVAGLRGELSRIVNFVEVEDDVQSLQDALFFRRVLYILRVPAGFTQDFVAGKTPALEQTAIPDAAQAVHINMLIDRYLNTAQLYLAALPGTDLETIAAYVSADLSRETQVQFAATESNGGQVSHMMLYFNFIAYSLMFAVIFGVATIMLVFNKIDIRRRNACAPVKPARFNTQIYLATTLFTLFCWALLVVLSLSFGHREAGAASTWYFVLNSFVFALCTSGISFLVGNLANSKDAIIAIANVLTLGSSFLSGVFVPRFLLGEDVLRVASFFPTYWYVKANERISQIMVFDWQNLAEIFQCMLIQAGFALVFFIAALVAGKYRHARV